MLYKRFGLFAAVVAVAASSVLVVGPPATAQSRPKAAAPPAVTPTRITGRVVDAAGHPLRGALVTSTPTVSLASPHTARTDRAGRYTLATGPGEQSLQVDGSQATGGNSDATGYRWAHARTLTVPYGHTVATSTVALQKAGAITGRVLDAKGHPLTGVVAHLEAVEPYVVASEYEFAYSDEATGAGHPVSHGGVFRIRGVTPGAYRLCFETDGRSVHGGAADARGYVGYCSSRPVSTSAGRIATAGPHRLAANTGSVVVGTVHGYDHHLLAGVQVAITAGRNHWYGFSDARGKYRVAVPVASSYTVCFHTDGVRTASATGYTSACRAHRLAVHGSGLSRADATLTKGAAISGTVRGANGAPLAGVPVTATFGYDSSDDIDTDTDNAGHYAFKNLRAGSYSICFEADVSTAAGPGNPYGGVGDCDVEVRTKAGTLRAGADDTLAAAGAISGVVTDQNGRPLANVQVDLEGDTELGNEGEFYAGTDAHGRFTAVDLPPVGFQVCFSNTFFYEQCYDGKDFDHAQTVTVRANTTLEGIDAGLRVTPGGGNSVGVVVRDSANRPLAGADAVLYAACNPKDLEDCYAQPLAGGKRRQVVQSDVTDAHGKVTWRDVPAGHYTVCVYGYFATTASGAAATGYADRCTSTTLGITITRSTKRAVAVRLPTAGAVTGRVTDKQGRPLAGVRVHVRGAAADDFVDDGYGDLPTPRLDAYTDADGGYTIRSVAPGRQSVCFDPSAAVGTRTAGFSAQCLGAKAGSTSGGRTVAVAAGHTTRGVSITLSPKPATKAVHATNAQSALAPTHCTRVVRSLAGTPGPVARPDDLRRLDRFTCP